MKDLRLQVLEKRADALPWKDWCRLLYRTRKYHETIFLPRQGKRRRRVAKHINAAYKAAGKPPFINHPWQ